MQPSRKSWSPSYIRLCSVFGAFLEPKSGPRGRLRDGTHGPHGTPKGPQEGPKTAPRGHPKEAQSMCRSVTLFRGLLRPSQRPPRRYFLAPGTPGGAQEGPLTAPRRRTEVAQSIAGVCRFYGVSWGRSKPSGTTFSGPRGPREPEEGPTTASRGSQVRRAIAHRIWGLLGIHLEPSWGPLWAFRGPRVPSQNVPRRLQEGPSRSQSEVTREGCRVRVTSV